MKAFHYTIDTQKAFDEAVRAVEEQTSLKGFRVLHIHDVTRTLAEKGFHREPLKIIEICNARYANEVLNRDVSLALMLPCPITVYTQENKTYISAFLPSVIGDFVTDKHISVLAGEVEQAVVEIVDRAAR